MEAALVAVEAVAYTTLVAVTAANAGGKNTVAAQSRLPTSVMPHSSLVSFSGSGTAMAAL
jgi:hypothetical protein